MVHRIYILMNEIFTMQNKASEDYNAPKSCGVKPHEPY